MSRIKACFDSLKEQNKSALIPFMTAGDPDPGQTVSLMHALVAGGANIIELGVPFSDPMADGPVIQRSSERALAHHVTLRDVIGMVQSFRQQDQTTPVILMGYLNPIEVMGYDSFVEKASVAGVDGVLIVDLPPEEAHDLTVALKASDMDQVFLIAPTTSDQRLESITRMASGFLYYVSLKGVTGSNRLDVADVASKLQHIKSKTDLPVGVGFGIKDAETAAAVAKVSDAVVIGSSLVDFLYTKANEATNLSDEAKIFLSSMRQAMDAA